MATANSVRPNYRIVTIYLMGVFIGALDTNVVGPVLTSITHSFRITLAWTAWTVTAYTVAYIGSTVMAGAMGDRFGHKKLFVIGVIAFGIASLMAAFSPNFVVFIIARALQGMGAGAVYPNAQAEGIRQFPREKRGMALGIFGAIFGVASIIGPTAGGILGQFFGWPSVFLINIPIVFLLLWATRRLPASSQNARALPDIAGGLSFAIMLAAVLLFVVTTGSLRWAFLVVAVAFVGVFLYRQKASATPFLDSAPLSNSAGVAMMIGAALIGLDMSASIFVPTLVQRALHFNIMDSGLALLPAAFSGALLSGAGGVLTDKIGPRKVLTMGLVAGAVGALFLAWPPLTFVRFVIAMVLLGMGTAFTMGAPLNRMALGLYREDQSGQALSLIAVFRGIGIAAGPVILTSAEVFHGFTGMFGSVVVASLVGVAAFVFVPDVRPSRSAKMAPEG